MDYKNNRDANIYYVEPQILKIQDEYEMKPLDRIQAIATLMTSFHVFDEKDIRKVCKDYKVQFSVVKKYIEDSKWKISWKLIFDVLKIMHDVCDMTSNVLKFDVNVLKYWYDVKANMDG